jgi:hypothetical protein
MPERYLRPIGASRIVFRDGALKMSRRGPLKFIDQRRGEYGKRAPERRGLWAFPFPYFDDWFACHKWDEVLPKDLRMAALKATDSDAERERLYAAREAWMRANAGQMPVRHFWWEGDVWARFSATGDIIHGGWQLLPMGVYARLARRLEPEMSWTHDHMEVFLAQGRGRMRGSADSPGRG